MLFYVLKRFVGIAIAIDTRKKSVCDYPVFMHLSINVLLFYSKSDGNGEYPTDYIDVAVCNALIANVHDVVEKNVDLLILAR